MIDAKQIRAARGLLDWTQETLAEMSGVARTTIKNVENGSTLPRLETSNALQRTLEESGVEFLPSSGVRIRDRIISVHEGQDANRLLLEDTLKTLRDSGGIIYVAHTDEEKAADDLGQKFLMDYIAKRRASNIAIHQLVRANDRGLLPPFETYRILPDKYFANSTFMIYGPKIALANWQSPQKVVIINDERFAEAARKLFEFVWDRTEMPAYKDIQTAKSQKP